MPNFCCEWHSSFVLFLLYHGNLIFLFKYMWVVVGITCVVTRFHPWRSSQAYFKWRVIRSKFIWAISLSELLISCKFIINKTSTCASITYWTIIRIYTVLYFNKSLCFWSQVKEMGWLPSPLPPQCKVIITSARSDTAHKALSQRNDINIHDIPLLKGE